MTTTIFLANADNEIEDCFDLIKALRPHIQPAAFLPQVRRQQMHGYSMLALREGASVKSVAGFRVLEFLAWGKVLYIDDLVTLPGETRQGYAGQLLDWLIKHAREIQCHGVHLDTGYTRFNAHRLYLRKGFQLSSHHMSIQLTPGFQP